MKHFAHLMLAIAAMLIVSCTSTETEIAPTRQITFCCSQPDVQVNYTRATLAEDYLTDLWIWEGTTLLSHQTSTDTDFGSPKVTLTYGTHNLTFVASSSKDQALTAGVWQTSKVIEVMAKTLSVTVDGSTQSSLSVELTRRNSRIQFTTTDNVPSDVTTCHLTVDNRKSLDKDLKAGTAYTHEATLDISSYQGKTWTNFVNTLTESLSDEEDADVMIEFLDASSNVVQHYERTVQIKSNRITNLTGAYFSGGSNLITVNTDWDTEKTTDLFPSE